MGKEVQEWLIDSRIPNLMSPVSGPRVGTWRSRYMIPIRLPWRLRARPSATLHEIQGQLRRANWFINDKDSSAVRQDRSCGQLLISPRDSLADGLRLQAGLGGIACDTARFDAHPHPIFRPQRKAGNQNDWMSRHRMDPEALGNCGHKQSRFHHGERRSDALPWSAAEREICESREL